MKQSPATILRGISTSLLIGAASTAVLSASSSQAAEVNYEGKTVRMMINFGAGSVTDIIHRVLAPHIAKNLPGKPTLIVENKPGGRGAAGLSFINKSRDKEGETFAVLAAVVARWVTGAKLPANPSKLAIVGARSNNQVVLVNARSTIKKFDDLKTFNEKIFSGTTSPKSVNSMRQQLFLEAIGAQYKIVGGYRGQTKVLKAVRSGELNYVVLNGAVYMSRRDGIEREGVVRGVMQLGVLDDQDNVVGSANVGLPTLDHAWRKLAPSKLNTKEYRTFINLYKAQSISMMYALPPGTRPEVVNVWENAVKAAYNDPAYLAEGRKQGLDDPVLLSSKSTAKRLSSFNNLFQDSDFQSVLADLGKKNKLKRGK
jgi:tripartite-type tricarboxylate transporter receptor subunit TctC